MKIYDGFIFFNELELLELRFMTLYNTVDYFVLVEAGQTHTGKKKDFIYEQNQHLFEKYKDKIRHVKIDLPGTSYPMEEEIFQRNCIAQGFTDAGPDDYLMISDIDEIPNPEGILEGIRNNWEQFVMEQKLTYYYVNCLQAQEWHGTVATKKKYFQTGQNARDRIRRPPHHIVKVGGWHYSFVGGIEKIKDKLNSFSEQGVNTPNVNNDEHIQKCMETGEDLFFRDNDVYQRYNKTYVSLDKIGHPQLDEWLKKYPHMSKL